MTLVVARTTPLGIRMFADMRITRREAAHPPTFADAELKLIVLSPALCVAYAGSVVRALAAIRSLRTDEGQMDLEEAEQKLLESHLDLNGGADFLVGSLRPTRLVSIKDGELLPCEAAWLGEHEAFAEYQEHYLRPPPYEWTEELDKPGRAEDINIASQMGRAMEAVVFGSPREVIDGVEHVVIPRGGRHASVGEAAVAVVPRVEDDLFKYMTLTHARAEQGDFGSAEGGAFSYSMLIPSEMGVAAMGIYFIEGRLGMLYLPLVLDEPAIYRTGSMDRFIGAVHGAHGITLSGFGFAGT